MVHILSYLFHEKSQLGHKSIDHAHPHHHPHHPHHQVGVLIVNVNVQTGDCWDNG